VVESQKNDSVLALEIQRFVLNNLEEHLGGSLLEEDIDKVFVV